MSDSVRPQDYFSSPQNFPGQATIVSNATSHRRGIMLGTYLNVAGERIHSSDRYVRLVQVGSTPARAERHTRGRSTAFLKAPGSLTIIPPGIPPNVCLHTVSKLTVCMIDKKLMEDFAKELDDKPFTLLDFKSGISDNAVGGILALMAEEFRTGSTSGALYIETLTHALAIKLLHQDCPSEHTATSATSPLPLNKLKKVNELIDAELANDLPLNVLARESGYSRSHFLRMFRVSTGKTPHRYVLEKRIDRAQRLLREKASSLADIAAACGFSSQTHMADIFRKHLNTTPGEYRRNL